MKKTPRLLASVLICLSLVLCLLPGAHAVSSPIAADITAATAFSGSGYADLAFLKDKNISSYKTSSGNASITLKNDAGIGSLYLLFDLEYGQYTIKNNTTGDICSAGAKGYLHEFVDLVSIFGGAVTDITLQFANGAVRLSEIYALSEGEAPEFVQKWDAPLDGGADLLLLATHGDDDQLFFAGLLPYYAKAKGYRVQVAYLTDHRNLTNARTHEMLNGLWAVGVTAYPVFGDFDDFRIDDLNGTYAEYQNRGTSKDQLQKFVVEQLRRFKPLVVVGHDLKGEYGHGMHMVYADLLTKALDMTNNAQVYPDLAEKYGTWDVPKTYLHLYGENKVVLDFDQKLDSLGGMSAFEITQKYGYPCHESQQYTWFTDWINGKNGVKITKATQIATYNPTQYGLYRSTVGADTLKNTLFENVTTYAEQERLEQERLEQERLEQERLEQERLEQERLEQERIEQERLEQERLQQEQEKQRSQRQKELTIAGIALALLVVALVIALWLLLRPKIRAKVRQK